MTVKDEVMVEVYKSAKAVLTRHEGDTQAAKEWLLEVLEKSDVSDECIAFYLRCIDVIDEVCNKKAANLHADQSKGLTAQNTAGTGRCGDYTTASRQIQGGI